MICEFECLTIITSLNRPNIERNSAFASSINSVAVSVGLEVGVKNIINTAYNMGITTPLEETRSICLGSSVVHLMELTNSYCTVVNDGKYNIPIMISRIEDRDGNVIYEAYYDADNKPFTKADGNAATRMYYNDHKKLIRTEYLDNHARFQCWVVC